MANPASDGSDPMAPSAGSAPGQRSRDAPVLALVELDPRVAVEGVLLDACFVADEVQLAGRMRERCPACSDVALQLVLRYQHVIRSHLYCQQCTRCFDARYPDGRSALSFLGVSID